MSAMKGAVLVHAGCACSRLAGAGSYARKHAKACRTGMLGLSHAQLSCKAPSCPGLITPDMLVGLHTPSCSRQPEH